MTAATARTPDHLIDEALDGYRWARLSVCIGYPYLASALHALRLRLTEAVPHAAVDARWRLYVNPAAFVSWEHVERCGVIYHEVNHLLRAHPARATGLHGPEFDEQLFGICADLEINDDIAKLGLALPEGALYPERFGLRPHRLVEEYYHEWPRIDPASSPPAAPSDERDGENPTDHSQTPPPWPTCGSGAHGVPMPWEDKSGDDGVSDLRAALISRRVADEINRAAGDAPAGLRRWAAGEANRPLDWKTILNGYLIRAARQMAGGRDYTYTRPSRRASAVPGVVLPTLRQAVLTVAVVVDTSGSMTPDDLRAAVDQVTELARVAGAGSVSVVLCDAQVSAVHQRVRSGASIEIVGGGGTYLPVGIETAAALRPAPDVVVVITDGWTEWPARPTRHATIACRLDSTAPDPPVWVKTVDYEPVAGSGPGGSR